MRTGEALALVKPTATVMDAALAMTASHGGSAIVVDKAGKLKGIFTDGDFRRLVASRGIWKVAFLRLVGYPLVVMVLLKYSGLARLAPNGETILLVSFLAAITPSASPYN